MIFLTVSALEALGPKGHEGARRWHGVRDFDKAFLRRVIAAGGR